MSIPDFDLIHVHCTVTPSINDILFVVRFQVRKHVTSHAVLSTVCHSSMRSLPSPLSSALLSMPICRCSVCILLKYSDRRGELQPGQIKTSREYKEHVARDKMRETAAAHARSKAESAILLETLEADGSNPSARIPVRHSDEPGRPERTTSNKPPRAVRVCASIMFSISSSTCDRMGRPSGSD